MVDISDDAALIAVIGRLWVETRFWDKIHKKEPTTLAELKRINIKESKAAVRRVIKPDHKKEPGQKRKVDGSSPKPDKRIKD